MNWFLLLEVFDPPVVEIVTQLRQALSGKGWKPNVHITVRGPVSERPSQEDFESSEIGSSLKAESIVLSGIGVFHNPEGSYVYMKAHGKIIEKLWSKRDFPKSEFGVNAHVTLYETKSAESADRVHRLLKHERLEFFCRELRLRWHQNGQKDLFGNEAYEEARAGRPDYRYDIGAPKIPSTLISRASVLASTIE